MGYSSSWGGCGPPGQDQGWAYSFCHFPQARWELAVLSWLAAQSACMTGSLTGGVGGCACKSCTKAQTSSMVWGGELVCSALILSTALPTSGDSVPVNVGVKLVQSTSSGELKLGLVM